MSMCLSVSVFKEWCRLLQAVYYMCLLFPMCIVKIHEIQFVPVCSGCLMMKLLPIKCVTGLTLVLS